MVKIRVGNKQNAFLNGEWAGHVRKWFKRHTSGKRRAFSKRYIKNQLKNPTFCNEGLGHNFYDND